MNFGKFADEKFSLNSIEKDKSSMSDIDKQERQKSHARTTKAYRMQRIETLVPGNTRQVSFGHDRSVSPPYFVDHPVFGIVVIICCGQVQKQ